MGLIESLPDGPIEQSMLEEIEASDSVDAVFPIHAQHEQDATYAMVLAINSEIRAALATPEGWEVVETREMEAAPEQGVGLANMDAVKELQMRLVEEFGIGPPGEG